jgi:hypothetical protein
LIAPLFVGITKGQTSTTTASILADGTELCELRQHCGSIEGNGHRHPLLCGAQMAQGSK